MRPNEWIDNWRRFKYELPHQKSPILKRIGGM